VTSTGQQRQQERRRRADDVDSPDQLPGQPASAGEHRDDLALVAGDLDRKENLSVVSDHARPVLGLSDINANPGDVGLCSHVFVLSFEVADTARGTPRRHIPEQRPSANLNQQPGHPGGPGEHSQ